MELVRSGGRERAGGGGGKTGGRETGGRERAGVTVLSLLTPMQLLGAVGALVVLAAGVSVRLGINPIVTLEKQRLNMIGKLV